jgi:hypothetical protein
VNGQVRSRTRPDSVMYYLTGAGSDGRARVVGVNPPDLPDYTQRTFLEANSPLYGDGVQPDANDSLEVLVDAGGLEPGTYRDTLDFLVNNPQAQLVEFPAEIEVTDKSVKSDDHGVITKHFEVQNQDGETLLVCDKLELFERADEG